MRRPINPSLLPRSRQMHEVADGPSCGFGASPAEIAAVANSTVAQMEALTTSSMRTPVRDQLFESVKAFAGTAG